MSYQSADKSVS